MDTVTESQRSANMSKIKSDKTTPEMFIRRNLYKRGLRYRVNFSKVKGKPDLYFSNNSTAVFINGCFWHRHNNCKYSSIPKTNTEYWETKLTNNKKRDETVYAYLKSTGIRVLVIWECTVKKMMKDPLFCDEYIEIIIQFIRSVDFEYLEI